MGVTGLGWIQLTGTRIGSKRALQIASLRVLRFLTRTVREADDRETRDTGLEVRLHLDLPRLEADERVGNRACEHPPDGRREGVP